MTSRLVLASSSPSRRMVLRNAGVDPAIIAPDFDEDAVLSLYDADPAATPADTVTALARGKAEAVLSSAEFAALAGDGTPLVVVACDSMLLLDGKLSGKPHTADEAIRRWKLQRGRAAELVTGHAIALLGHGEGTGGGRRKALWHAEAVSTTVRFGSPTDADVEAYARSGEPLGCAGAFTLEARGGWFIDGIDGDPSSVLGISLPLLRRTLAGWGLDVSDFWARD